MRNYIAHIWCIYCTVGSPIPTGASCATYQYGHIWLIPGVKGCLIGHRSAYYTACTLPSGIAMGLSCLPPGHTSVTIDWPTACPVLYHRLPISICMTSVVYYCVKYSPPAGLATWDSNTGLILLFRLFLTYFSHFFRCTVQVSSI